MSTPQRYIRSTQKQVVKDISESLGKLPPQACDLEEAVLGALMLEKNAFMEVGGFLRPEHFYKESNREIYQAIVDLFGESEPIDMRTVVARLRKNGKIEIVGGAFYIAELTSKVSQASNVESHARVLVEFAVKRNLIEMASGLHHDAYEDTTDAFELVQKHTTWLQEILDKATGDRAEKSVKQIAYDFILELQARMGGHTTGIPTGFGDLDVLLNGFNKTDLIIIAARPAMGKSAMAVQAAKQIAERNMPVGIFSLEMSKNQIIERLTCAEAEVFADRVRKGKLDGHEFKLVEEKAGLISTLPIYIDDTAALSIVELRARAMRMKAKYNIQLLVIDYLQLIHGSYERTVNNRDQELGLITRTLKRIAKELDIPVVALSQLSRDVEKRGKTARPILSDLRESGSIEQDADVVMFLYRPEYYHVTVDENGMPTQGLCEVIVAKQRNGATDTVKLKFVGRYTKFMPWIDSAYQSMPRMDQSDYVKKHYKDPTQKLPSEIEPEEFKQDDLPF